MFYGEGGKDLAAGPRRRVALLTPPSPSARQFEILMFKLVDWVGFGFAVGEGNFGRVEGLPRFGVSEGGAVVSRCRFLAPA